MKTFMVILLLIGLTFSSYSQDKKMENGEKGNVKFEELPAVVIKRAGADFSVYLPDKHPSKSVTDLQEKFVAYDLGKDYEGFESYLLIMQSKNRNLAATYNENGKLIRVVENYKNIRMPNSVIYSIYKNYPEWTVVKDKYTYTQEEGDILKKQYNVKIKKGKEIMRLKVNDKGEILKAK